MTMTALLKTLRRRPVGLAMAALLFLAFAESAARAQQPFQDAKGKGSTFINGGGFVQVNVADPSIKVGYLHEVNPNRWSIGFDASGKLTGTRANLLTDNRTAPDAQASVSIGLKYLFTHRLDITDPEDQAMLREAQARAVRAGLKPNDDLGEYLTEAPYDRLSFQFGYSHKQYKLFDPAAPFADQVSKKSFHSPFAALNYFRQMRTGHLLGLGFGVERSNNASDLTEVEVRDITTGANDGVTREAVRTQKALRGEYQEGTGTFFNTDYVVFPSWTAHRLGVNFFSRNGVSGKDKGFRPGLGLFLSEKGAPTRVIGGASVTLVEGKPNVALFAGFNFK